MSKHTDPLLAAITQSTPTMVRACARCGRDLTDAASLEAGIGPVCRRKDNAVLARQIPSNLREARHLITTRRRFLGGVDPAVAPVLDAVVEDIRHGRGREDWRVTVKRMEWLVSTDAARGMLLETLYLLTEALGYIALVSLWKGELAIGSSRKTTLSFADDHLVLESVRPPRAVVDKLRAIRGRRFDGTRKAWTFPASEHEAVSVLVRRHFLAPQGVDDALAKAKAHRQAQAPQASDEPAPAFSIEPLEGEAETAVLRTPYDPRFVAALKAAIQPAKQRWWDRARRAWIVEGAVHITKAREIARQHFASIQ